MSFPTQLIRALLIAGFVGVLTTARSDIWSAVKSKSNITTVKLISDHRVSDPKHLRSVRGACLLPIWLDNLNPPNVPLPNNELRADGPEVPKENEIHLVIITMPVYRNEKVDRQVLHECFEILGQLRSEAAFTSLEFHKEYILARTSRKHAPKFLGAFTGKFAYGIESGVENIVRKEWEHRTGG
jgi:hypothetical protein